MTIMAIAAIIFVLTFFAAGVAVLITGVIYAAVAIWETKL